MSRAPIRTLAILLVLAAASPARADVGIGLFVGEPVGLDVKIGLQRNSAIDLVFGWDTIRDGRGPYGHFTYLLTPFRGRGQSVTVPFRIGLGIAVFDRGRNRDFGNDINVAARVPMEIALAFRSTPLELYGEVALKLTFVDQHNDYQTVDLDGGIGLRFYF